MSTIRLCRAWSVSDSPTTAGQLGGQVPDSGASARSTTAAAPPTSWAWADSVIRRASAGLLEHPADDLAPCALAYYSRTRLGPRAWPGELLGTGRAACVA